MNGYKFLRVYRDVAKNMVHPDDLMEAYWDLKFQVMNSDIKNLEKWFVKSKPRKIEMALGLDAVAHDIHQNGNGALQAIFPGASYSVFKEQLDLVAGFEKSSEIRKANRGYYTPLLAARGMIFLEKQSNNQVGKTTKDDIAGAIQEYERLYKAGIASPAEILTLYRYFGPGSMYEKVVVSQNLHDEENEPLVVGGPASVAMVDKEGHLITADALEGAFNNFMKSFRTRNAMVFHSDVQTGWVIPAYITKAGQIFKSGVDEHGLWVISEIRGDTRVAERMADEIEKGNIRSYSIAGSALDTQEIHKGSQDFMEVRAMELAEITFCVVPGTKVWVKQSNSMSKLKPISQIAVDDLVLTHDMYPHKVTKILERQVDEEILEITTRHGSIQITKEHPVLILGRGANSWVDAKDLKKGQTVKFLDKHLDHSSSEIISIKKMPYKGLVYNLEVEEDNSYLTEFMAVHNCTPAGTEIWTKEGLKKIEDITKKDLVYTHKNRWMPVVHTMAREITENIIQLTTDKNDVLQITKNHPIRAMVYEGRNNGTHYDWVPAGEIKEGDLVSAHFPKEGLNCFYCYAPLFCGNNLHQKMKFCDNVCRGAAPGNRKGATIENGDPWAIELSRRRQLQYQDPEFCEKHFTMLNNNRRLKARPNKAETKLHDYLDSFAPGEWQYVGNGQLIIGGRNPDFVHKNANKLIEFFGDYWHKDDDGVTRVGHFRKHGYETLIIWEKELNDAPSLVKENVQEFVNNELIKIVKVEEIPFEGLVYNFEVEEDHSYTTKAMVIKNCEDGVNSGAKFDILKSRTSSAGSLSRFKDVWLGKAKELPSLLKNNLFLQNNTVVIQADRENSITDAMYLELRKYIPDEINIVVMDNLDPGVVPLFKQDYGSGPYSQLVRNYPEFNNSQFRNYVGQKTGKAPDEFADITRGDIDRISQQWLKDKRSILPEFSTAYVQKEMALHTIASELAKKIDGDVFKQNGNEANALEIYQDANYKPAKDEVGECHTCEFFSEGFCTALNLPVDPEYTCKFYHPMPGADKAEEWAEATHKPYEEKEMEKMGNIGLLKEWLKKQWQNPDMDFANDWEQTEKDRRTKLEELQKELGYPERIDLDKESGWPEVKEDWHLPWNVNESGVKNE